MSGWWRQAEGREGKEQGVSGLERGGEGGEMEQELFCLEAYEQMFLNTNSIFIFYSLLIAIFQVDRKNLHGSSRPVAPGSLALPNIHCCFALLSSAFLSSTHPLAPGSCWGDYKSKGMRPRQHMAMKLIKVVFDKNLNVSSNCFFLHRTASDKEIILHLGGWECCSQCVPFKSKKFFI